MDPYWIIQTPHQNAKHSAKSHKCTSCGKISIRSLTGMFNSVHSINQGHWHIVTNAILKHVIKIQAKCKKSMTT